MQKTSSLDYSYAAGFLDGECCFDIRSSKKPNGRTYYSIRARVAQVYPEVLYYLQSLFGGNVFHYPSKNEKWKDKYELELSNLLVENLIEKIYQYSIVKKPQLDLLKEFIEIRKSQNSFRKSEEDFNREQEIVRKIKSLNSEKTSIVISKDQREPVEITDELAAYYAGFTDGEGCIGISKATNKLGGINTNLTVQIAQCKPEVLEKLRDIFGGTSSTTTLNLNNKKQSNCSKITLVGKRAAEFLSFIEPYAVVKKNQILNGLSYWNFKTQPKEVLMEKVKVGNGRYTWKRSESTLRKEQNFYNLMKILNKRGN